jgi:hypothetical protein
VWLARFDQACRAPGGCREGGRIVRRVSMVVRAPSGAYLHSACLPPLSRRQARLWAQAASATPPVEEAVEQSPPFLSVAWYAARGIDILALAPPPNS